jgi:hypothetical protein
MKFKALLATKVSVFALHITSRQIPPFFSFAFSQLIEKASPVK